MEKNLIFFSAYVLQNNKKRIKIQQCIFFMSLSSSASEIMHHWSSRTNINTSIVHKDSRGKLAILWMSTSRASVYMCVTLSTPLSLIVIQSSCLPFLFVITTTMRCSVWLFYIYIQLHRYIILTIDRTSQFTLKICCYDSINCNYNSSNGFC